MSKESHTSRIKEYFRTPRGSVVGLWSAFFLLWASLAPFMPYMGLYYESVGFSGTQIGTLGSMRSAVTFVSSILLAFLSDALPKRRLILAICVIGLAAMLILFPYARTFSAMLPLVSIFSICLSPVSPILTEDTLRILKNPRNYSKMRMGGSVGWGITALLTGWIIEQPGVELTIIFRLCFLFFPLFLLLLWALPEAKAEPKKPVSEKVTPREVWDMLRMPYFAPWLVIVMLWGMAESSVGTFLFLHIQNLGGATSLMGTSMSLAILGEIVGFTFARRVQGRIGARRMIIIAFLLRGIWFLVVSTFQNPVFILPFEVLGGLSFAFLLSGSVAYINRRAPARIGTTAQAIRVAVMLGLGGGTGALVSGLLYDALGSAGMFRVMGYFMMGTLVLASILRAADRRHERAHRA